MLAATSSQPVSSMRSWPWPGNVRDVLVGGIDQSPTAVSLLEDQKRAWTTRADRPWNSDRQLTDPRANVCPGRHDPSISVGPRRQGAGRAESPLVGHRRRRRPKPSRQGRGHHRTTTCVQARSAAGRGVDGHVALRRRHAAGELDSNRRASDIPKDGGHASRRVAGQSSCQADPQRQVRPSSRQAWRAGRQSLAASSCGRHHA